MSSSSVLRLFVLLSVLLPLSRSEESATSPATTTTTTTSTTTTTATTLSPASESGEAPLRSSQDLEQLLSTANVSENLIYHDESTPGSKSSTPSPKETSSCPSETFECSCTTESIELSEEASPQSEQKRDQRRPVCMSEDCVVAAATILSSLDRSVDPCDDFYQYACGGWIERSIITNTDRFSAIDKRNQNLVARALRSNRESLFDPQDVRAETKARRFFHACASTPSYGADDIKLFEENDRKNLLNLRAIVGFAGGWKLTGVLNESISFNERVRLIHNKLGLNVFFTWGVIDHNRANRLAVIAGGWNDAFLVEETDRSEYLKVMSTLTLMLAQADPVVVAYDPEADDIHEDDFEIQANSSEVEGFFESLLPSYSYDDYVGLNDSPSWMHPNGYNRSAPEDQEPASAASASDAAAEVIWSRVFKALNPFGWSSGGDTTEKDEVRIDLVDDEENATTYAPVLDIEVVLANDSLEEAPPPAQDDISLHVPEVFDDWELLYQEDADEAWVHEEEIEIQDLPPESISKGQDLPKDKSSSSDPHASTPASESLTNPSIQQSAPESSESGDPISVDAHASSPFYNLYDESYNQILVRNSQIDAAMSDVIDFEGRLANITEKPTDTSNLVAYTIRDMEAKFPFLEWSLFFKSAFVDFGTFHGQSEAEQQANAESDSWLDTEILIQEDFLQGVNALVLEYMSSPWGQNVLINYMIWRLLAAFYPDRPVEHATREESEVVEQVDTMVDIMKAAFKANLQGLDWMSAHSRKQAEDKLEHMVDLIGYPKFVLNSTWVDSIYAGIEVTADDYLMNVVTYRAFLRHSEIRQYFQPYSRGKWNDFAHMANIATVNAYYNQASNTMVVPIGMLQPPIFWTRPKSLTFGAFGIVVAHEITHAFDDLGIMYDPWGNYKQLYDNATVEKFHEASDCVRKQYSNFTLVRGHNVDGNVTLGENIADHGGLRIAEVAYQTWQEQLRTGQEDHMESRLPAITFSPEQLFFLGYALPWCSIHTESMLTTHIAKDEHAPEKFRVLGPLANSEMFSQAWNCPLGSRMNPVEKCSIW